MQKPHGTHPIELALTAALVVAEALTVLVVALVALVLTVARWRPAAPVTAATELPPVTPAPAPLQHPLTVVADALVATLEPLTVAQLRRLARSAGLPRAITRTGRRTDLLQALIGLEVAACS
jgi:L-aminopeptidase/D-esterase-like protein